MKTSERERRIRNYVIARDGEVCCYCEKELAYDEITMEHIHPESKRGSFNTTNLTVACGPCNNTRGNIPFFEYCKKFNWSQNKIDKYKKLYFNNLKIKVLNMSLKEKLPKSGLEVPSLVINQVCQKLKIKSMSFTKYQSLYKFDINFDEPTDAHQIKYCFQQLIKLIELDSL